MFTPREASLITEEQAADGRISLRATNEAINVVVGALDIDVESGQAAAEARLQNLIQRGRFVVEQAPELLERAREHLEQRLETERALIHNLEEAREQAERPQLDLRTIARLIATLRDCSTRHVALHGRVMQARGVFLEEQARQEFAPPASIRVFDLRHDSLLALSVADAEPLLERFPGRVLGRGRRGSRASTGCLRSAAAGDRARRARRRDARRGDSTVRLHRRSATRRPGLRRRRRTPRRVRAWPRPCRGRGPGGGGLIEQAQVGKLLACAMQPKLTAARDEEYRQLLELYRDDVEFRGAVDDTARARLRADARRRRARGLAVPDPDRGLQRRAPQRPSADGGAPARARARVRTREPDFGGRRQRRKSRRPARAAALAACELLMIHSLWYIHSRCE
jgi:hypothetical protein